MRKKIIFGVFTVLILGGIGLYIFFDRRINGLVVPSDLTSYDLRIESGELFPQILAKMAEKGFVSDTFILRVYVRFHPEIAENIQSGEYRVQAGAKVLDVLASFRAGKFENRVTFIEGWRREEYAARLATVRDEAFAKEFLALTQNKEGMLFPDTYFIDANTTPEELVEKLTSTFDQVFNEVVPDVSAIGLTKTEIVTLASLLEREVHDQIDRQIVAGILLSRLQAGWGLDVDATVQYALASETAGGTGVLQSGEFDWWPTITTEVELAIDSPYNTRKYGDLPPAPICNPSRSALEAFVNPVPTEYWYYLTDAEGVTRYAATLEEHNQNIINFGLAQ